MEEDEERCRETVARRFEAVADEADADFWVIRKSGRSDMREREKDNVIKGVGEKGYSSHRIPDRSTRFCPG